MVYYVIYIYIIFLYFLGMFFILFIIKISVTLDALVKVPSNILKYFSNA